MSVTAQTDVEREFLKAMGQTAPAKPAAAIVTPGPGVYRGVPMDEYHAWDALSNSRMGRLKQSPAHLQAYIHEPPKDKAHFRIGRAIHTSILEPHEFDRTFAVADQCVAELKSGKNAGERCSNPGLKYRREEGWLCGQHSKGLGSDENRTVISMEMMECCTKLRESVHAHEAAHELLMDGGQTELSVVWIDEETGVRCKARFDYLAPSFPGGAILDLKSTTDASERAFGRAAFVLGYYRQGFFYLEGARAAGLQAAHFVNIALEKEAPYAVGVYRLIEGVVDAGRDECRRLLRRYADCVERNEWPAYSQQVCDIALPDWSWRQLEEEAAQESAA